MSLHIEIHKCTQVGLSQQFLRASEKGHLFLGSRGKCQIQEDMSSVYTQLS